MSNTHQLKLLRTLIREVLDGFANKNTGRDGIGGNLRYDVQTTGHSGASLGSDEDDWIQQEKQASAGSQAACCLVMSKDGKKILAVSRKDDPNDFGLPGGRVDAGEEIVDAAKRELEEETGLIASKLSKVFVQDDDHGYTTTTFSCRVAGDIDTEETGVVKWVTPDVLLRGQFGSYNRALFKKLNIKSSE